MPREPSIQIRRYGIPYPIMVSAPPDCHLKYGFITAASSITTSIHARNANTSAADAVFFTLSWFFSPNALEITAFNPTAMPSPMADIMI